MGGCPVGVKFSRYVKRLDGSQEMEGVGPGVCILNWYILEHFKYISLSNSKKGEKDGCPNLS